MSIIFSDVMIRKSPLVMHKRELIPRVPTYPYLTTLPENYHDFEAVVLYFIHSCGLRYLKPSNDPIFPATLEGSDSFWTDPASHAHSVGCRQSFEICGSDGECYNVADLDSWAPFSTGSNKSAAEVAVLNLLTIAMKRTDVVLELPNAPELLAERLHSNSLSLGLDDGHWRQEMRRRFNITLATVQGLVVDMIQGRHDDTMREFRVWPGPDTLRAACSSVKFQTVGWRNINLVELILFSTSLLILWISTIKYNDRIFLVWLFMSLTSPRFCRVYKVSKDVINAPFTAIAQTIKALLPRRTRLPPCQPNAQDLAQMRSFSQDTT